MNFRECLFHFLKVELPTSKPLIADVIPQLAPTSKTGSRKFLFDTMYTRQNIVDNNGRVLVANVPMVVDAKVSKMLSNRDRYQAISGRFKNPIRWYHVALIHEMECSQNFNCYLGNGQPFNKKTTIVPKGRGAFPSFETGAVDAIVYQKLDRITDWSIENTLYILEGFNGYGYTNRGINSPYLWSGSNHYKSGKYIADSVYSKTAVSSQIGIALLYKRLLERI